MKINIYLITGLLLLTHEIFSQSVDFNCGFIPNQDSIIGFNFQGITKPIRTDTIDGVGLPEGAFFPVLVVFVQFKNEDPDPRNSWPADSSPTYLSHLISTQKRTSGDWWNYYNENSEMLSDHWIEISRGRLHVVSPSPTGVGAFSVVLSQEASLLSSSRTGRSRESNQQGNLD